MQYAIVVWRRTGRSKNGVGFVTNGQVRCSECYARHRGAAIGDGDARRVARRTASSNSTVNGIVAGLLTGGLGVASVRTAYWMMPSSTSETVVVPVGLTNTVPVLFVDRTLPALPVRS
jgi:hypothetical protein